MSNVDISGENYFFKINGGDTQTAGFLKTVVIILTAMIVLAGFFVAPKSDTGLIVFLCCFVVYILTFVFIIRSVLNGSFARYKVKIDGRNIAVYDKKLDQVLFEISFKPEYLKVTDTITNYGALIQVQKALIYSEHDYDRVEEQKPSRNLIVLCAGRSGEITEIKNRLEKLHSIKNI
jgi:hypothetical protein